MNPLNHHKTINISENIENWLNFFYDAYRNFSNSFDSFLVNEHSMTAIHREFKCILFHARGENALVTFDRTHKIRVILSKQQIMEKILKNNSFLKETQFNKYTVTLINPAFDIKIGFDLGLGKYYSNFVLVCEDYSKHEKYPDKIFLQELEKNEYVDAHCEIFEDSKFIDKVLEKLHENNNFGYRDSSDYFLFNEFLFLSKKMNPKCKENNLKEGASLMFDKLETNLTIDQYPNLEENGKFFIDKFEFNLTNGPIDEKDNLVSTSMMSSITNGMSVSRDLTITSIQNIKLKSTKQKHLNEMPGENN